MYFEEQVMNPFPNYNDFGKAKEFWLNLRFFDLSKMPWQANCMVACD
jgi:hypothetical protein